ncbi:hypothetical protein ACFWBN_07520 [Streptomyces sp. NPDC059989]|uniref:hypothetical protein n=1 Tax=Streptomyces sp. NPDC059989 TaxID=3347026 RepID=UPI0036A0E0BA
MRRTAKRLRALAALAGFALLPAFIPAQAQAAGTRPFSVTITHVGCVDPCSAEGLEAALEGHPDFYVKVFIDGVEHRTPTIDNVSGVDPYWVVSTELADTYQNVPVTIQVWDADDTSGDDLGDDTPHDDDNNLDFTVSYTDGKWRDTAVNKTDNVNWPQSCSSGDGDTGSDEDEPAVKVCWDVSTTSTVGDADGDGLLDGWERNGYNEDGDGTIDVNLPAMGAKADHKDVFLELDWTAGREPTRAGIQAMKRAFAAAPKDVGATASSRRAPNGGFGVNAPPNPDGRDGINLHVDTGGLVDPGGREGGPVGTCSDGVDNGTDGLVDGLDPTCNRALVDYLDASVENPQPTNCTDGVNNDGDAFTDSQDPDCLVGDNLGRGGVIADPGACGLDKATFYASKSMNFDRPRRLVFHYGQIVPQPGVATCPEQSGGEGEVGGNDFVVFNVDAGTIMHELGHNLNLRHGGHEPKPNCKPNYVSVMNYDLQEGIPRVGGGTILDFSPPRRTVDGTSRGTGPLPDLRENALTEPTILDGADPNNRFMFVDSTGQKLPNNLNTSPNWNHDTDPPFESTVPATNIDDAGPAPLREPAACINASTNELLHGSDDWNSVSLPFRQFGESADAAINPEDDDDLPTTSELLAMHEERNTTDVGVSVTDNPEPVAAGTDVVYTAVVTNHGFRPAAAVTLVDTLPSQVSYVSDNAACHASGGTVTCGVGDLLPGASRTVTITAHVPADLVYNAGGPVTLTNRAVVDNLMGPDPVADNDSATTDTRVVAVADLAVTSFAPTAPPTQVLIGQTLDVTLHGTVANNGPSSPMDAVVVTAATADPGATVTPSSATRNITALAVGTPQSLDSTFTVGCAQPGSHTYRFTASITPARSDDTDPALANNHRPAEFTLDCVVPVAINIKPGGNPNSINIPADTVPLGVLTTGAGEYALPLAFNATSIQPLTVRFGPRNVVYGGTGGSAEVHDRGHIEDVVERTTTPVERVRDGDRDMMLHFASATSGLRRADTEACAKGSFTDGATGRTYRFFGCDAVRIVQP